MSYSNWATEFKQLGDIFEQLYAAEPLTTPLLRTRRIRIVSAPQRRRQAEITRDLLIQLGLLPLEGSTAEPEPETLVVSYGVPDEEDIDATTSSNSPILAILSEDDKVPTRLEEKFVRSIRRPYTADAAKAAVYDVTATYFQLAKVPELPLTRILPRSVLADIAPLLLKTPVVETRSGNDLAAVNAILDRAEVVLVSSTEGHPGVGKLWRDILRTSKRGKLVLYEPLSDELLAQASHARWPLPTPPVMLFVIERPRRAYLELIERIAETDQTGESLVLTGRGKSTLSRIVFLAVAASLISRTEAQGGI